MHINFNEGQINLTKKQMVLLVIMTLAILVMSVCGIYFHGWKQSYDLKQQASKIFDSYFTMYCPERQYKTKNMETVLEDRLVVDEDNKADTVISNLVQAEVKLESKDKAKIYCYVDDPEGIVYTNYYYDKINHEVQTIFKSYVDDIDLDGQIDITFTAHKTNANVNEDCMDTLIPFKAQTLSGLYLNADEYEIDVDVKVKESIDLTTLKYEYLYQDVDERGREHVAYNLIQEKEKAYVTYEIGEDGSESIVVKFTGLNKKHETSDCTITYNDKLFNISTSENDKPIDFELLTDRERTSVSQWWDNGYLKDDNSYKLSVIMTTEYSDYTSSVITKPCPISDAIIFDFSDWFRIEFEPADGSEKEYQFRSTEHLDESFGIRGINVLIGEMRNNGDNSRIFFMDTYSAYNKNNLRGKITGDAMIDCGSYYAGDIYMIQQYEDLYTS